MSPELMELVDATDHARASGEDRRVGPARGDDDRPRFQLREGRPPAAEPDPKPRKGPRVAGLSRPKIEVLYITSCTHYEDAIRFVERVTAQLGLEPELRRIRVADSSAVRRHRFLGSPTIRVEGRDIEPGAEERTDYIYDCRLYHTGAGVQSQPDEAWLRGALRRWR